MSREEQIEYLRNEVLSENICYIDDLKQACEKYNKENPKAEPINEFDDIVFPIGWNSCDRCGRLADSEWNMFWLDGFDWNDDDPAEVRMQKRLLEEKDGDYVAICYGCVAELKRE